MHQSSSLFGLMALLECLHVLNNGVLLCVTQIGTVDLTIMAGIGIPRGLGIELEEGPAVFLGDIGDKANLFPVVDVIATVEHLGSLICGIEQIPQGRYRTVVQIGRPQPQAVKWHIGVTVSLAKLFEAPLIADIQGILISRQHLAVGIEPSRIGADGIEGVYLTQTGKASGIKEVFIPFFHAMAVGAILGVELLALGVLVAVNGICIRWR